LILEDSISVLGNVIALTAIGLSGYMSAPVIDAGGSITVGLLMLYSAYIVFQGNMEILIGR